MYAPFVVWEKADDISKALSYFFTWLPSGYEAYWYWLSSTMWSRYNWSLALMSLAVKNKKLAFSGKRKGKYERCVYTNVRNGKRHQVQDRTWAYVTLVFVIFYSVRAYRQVTVCTSFRSLLHTVWMHGIHSQCIKHVCVCIRFTAASTNSNVTFYGLLDWHLEFVLMFY